MQYNTKPWNLAKKLRKVDGDWVREKVEPHRVFGYFFGGRKVPVCDDSRYVVQALHFNIVDESPRFYSVLPLSVSWRRYVVDSHSDGEEIAFYNCQTSQRIHQFEHQGGDDPYAFMDVSGAPPDSWGKPTLQWTIENRKRKISRLFRRKWDDEYLEALHDLVDSAIAVTDANVSDIRGALRDLTQKRIEEGVLIEDGHPNKAHVTDREVALANSRRYVEIDKLAGRIESLGKELRDTYPRPYL